jgi:hypothetical protein
VADSLAVQTGNAARYVAALPRALAATMAEHVQREVADPLTAHVRQAAPGPWGPRLTIASRAGADPAVSVGGTFPVLSGGARGVDLVYGLEFGGSAVRSLRNHRPYVRNVHNPRARPGFTTLSRTNVWRNTTAQFVPRRGFIFPTFRAYTDETFEAWVSVLDEFVTSWEAGAVLP